MITNFLSKKQVSTFSYGTLVVKKNCDLYGSLTHVAPMALYSSLILAMEKDWKKPKWNLRELQGVPTTPVYPY